MIDHNLLTEVKPLYRVVMIIQLVKPTVISQLSLFKSIKKIKSHFKKEEKTPFDNLNNNGLVANNSIPCFKYRILSGNKPSSKNSFIYDTSVIFIYVYILN